MYLHAKRSLSGANLGICSTGYPGEMIFLFKLTNMEAHRRACGRRRDELRGRPSDVGPRRVKSSSWFKVVSKVRLFHDQTVSEGCDSNFTSHKMFSATWTQCR